jgi:hypothetical protein
VTEEEVVCCALLGCSPNKQAHADTAKPVQTLEIRTMSPRRPNNFALVEVNLPSPGGRSNSIAKRCYDCYSVLYFGHITDAENSKLAGFSA